MRKPLLFLLLFTVLLTVGLFLIDEPRDVSAQGSIPAFPGAEGYGALALNSCDRSNMKVIQVTNTNRDGPGSLRDAVAQTRNGKLDIIIFRTGGTIEQTASLKLRGRDCLYIAGQTAPGDGIQIKRADDPTHTNTLIETWRDRSNHDIVLRYLRLRSGRGEAAKGDVIGIKGGYNIVLDHISTAWGNDKSITINSGKKTSGFLPIDHITVQWNMITTTLWPHNTGMPIGSDSFEPDHTDFSIHHNAFIHNAHRNPLIKRMPKVQIINNLVYNWTNRIGYVSCGSTVDYINNYWKKGWKSNSDYIIDRTSVVPNTFDPPCEGTVSQYYASGNVVGERTDFTVPPPPADQTQFFKYGYVKTGPVPDSSFVSTAFAAPPIAVTIHTAAEAYDLILQDAGASQKLACNGDWVNARDKLDVLLMSHVEDGKGVSSNSQQDHQNDFCYSDGTCGHPVLAKGTACTDSDGDGLPNAWESRYFSSTTLASITGDQDSDGYTNIEEYINGTDPGNAENLPPVGPSPPVGPPPPVPAGVSPPPPPGPGFIPPLPVVFPAVDLNFPNPLQVSSPGEFIEKLADLLFTLSLILAPVLLVISGIIFMSAAGNPQRVAIAKRMLLYTIIGFTVILLSRGLVSVVQGVLGG